MNRFIKIASISLCVVMLLSSCQTTNEEQAEETNFTPSPTQGVLDALQEEVEIETVEPEIHEESVLSSPDFPLIEEEEERSVEAGEERDISFVLDARYAFTVSIYKAEAKAIVSAPELGIVNSEAKLYETSDTLMLSSTKDNLNIIFYSERLYVSCKGVYGYVEYEDIGLSGADIFEKS